MTEALKSLERIHLPVEEDVWGMFVDALPQGFVPGSIILVGDDGKGTLAFLADESYPQSKIMIVDRSPVIIKRLTPIAKQHGWSVFTGDITNSDTIADIVKKTSGGAAAVFMKHGVHLNHPRNQEHVGASLFRLARRVDSWVGVSRRQWSVCGCHDRTHLWIRRFAITFFIQPSMWGEIRREDN